MKEFQHFYSRYGQALLASNDIEGIKQEIKYLLVDALNHFRLAANFYEGVVTTPYSYKNIRDNKTQKGEFLASHILTNNKSAKGVYDYAQKIISLIDNNTLNLSKNESVKQRIAPSVGEYNNGKSRHTPKASMFEAICCLLTTLTRQKPCISPKDEKGVNINHCIIPDLGLADLRSFVQLFQNMLSSGTSSTLLIGKVKKDNTKFKPLPPEIYYGNFPNPPKSGYLATLGVIASIAEWGKEAEQTAWANKVLESLKDTTLYLVTYGDAKPFKYSHFVIDIAKQGRLRQIIDSIFHTQLFGKSRWNFSSKADQTDYEKFDLFASRFLQLFNGPSLKDFISFRGEYQYHLEIIFKTYFMKIENIPHDIVQSARELGKWLNYVAYVAAKEEDSNTKSEEFKKAKAKVLVELESTAFSAKSGDSLIAQVVTRAGRISGMDAPVSATLFLENTCSGAIELEKARNLIMAFSRLKSKYQRAGSAAGDAKIIPSEDSSQYEEE